MKTIRSGLLASWLLAASLALVTTGCSTFQYRQVQRNFEEAVLADNDQINPVIDRSADLYTEVAASLTQERIAKLDPKLEANAWMLRAFSEWRSGQFAEARDSARSGLAADPVPHSRDDVLLHLIPALVIDSELMNEWIDGGRVTDPGRYRSSQERDFGSAFGKISAAKGRIGPATPLSTVYYVEYQSWRIIQNWREVISLIPDSQREERRQARDRARVNGKKLEEAAKDSRDAIPESHFLRQRIVAQDG